MLGFFDGLSVGELEGLNEGDELGDLDGLLEGPALGLVVGTAVGSLVAGCFVLGSDVMGLVDGKGVGCLLGIDVVGDKSAVYITFPLNMREREL